MTDTRGDYAKRYGLTFSDFLGDGTDGSVWKVSPEGHAESSLGEAVKILKSPGKYMRELRAYRALEKGKISEIAKFQIPRLIRTDEDFLAIQMTIVKPPFLLDFARTYTDEEIAWLGYSDEVLAEREGHWAEIFGERWDAVILVRAEFHRLTGLHLMDLSLNNIRFDN